MTGWALLGLALFAASVWRHIAYRRRLDRARERLYAMRAEHDERAARAALAPRSGDVLPFPVHPPTNGKL